MVIGKAIQSFICSIINAFPNKKLLGYSFTEQWKDLIPSLCLSLFMGVVVLSVELLGLNSYITMMIQIPLGGIIYLGLAYMLKFECLDYIITLIKPKIKRKKCC